jgi:serine O-acetyltransferase
MKPIAFEKAPPLPNGASNLNPPDIGFWALVHEDFITHERDWFSQGFWAVFWHRFGNARMSCPRVVRLPMTLVYHVMRKLCQVVGGIKLDYTVALGRRVKIEHFGGMILGARSIGSDVIIRQNTTMGIRSLDDLNGKPIIEDGVNIGAGAVIVGHIVIGAHSVIGANCVVSRSVPPGSFVRSAPVEIRPLRSTTDQT